MNDDFRNVFKALQNEVVWLHARYLSYKKLYGKSEERIALLNSSASSFFYHLQFILLDDIELFICKLLDPAKYRSNLNLTLEQLLNLIDDGMEFKAELIKKLHAVQLEASELRHKRNKRLSHFDLEISITRKAEFFTKASRNKLECILSHIREFLNIVEYHYFGSNLLYEQFSSTGDAESLVNSLKRSEAYKTLEKEKAIEHGYWHKKNPFSKA
jgi:hypothetical protein